MFKSTRPALLAGLLWSSAFLPALAQAPAQTPAAAPAVAPAAVPDENAVVATVNDTKFTWKQIFENFEKDSPTTFKATMAQLLATKAADTLFGGTGAASVTLTRDDALAAARATPPPPLVQYVQGLTRKEALRQEAVKNNVAVTDAQAEARLTAVLQQLRKQGAIQPQQTDAQFLASRNLTRDEVKNNSIVVQMQIGQLIEKDMAKTLGHPVSPNDFFQARHILIAVNPDQGNPGSGAPAPSATPAATEKAFEAARVKLEAISKDIKSGKTTFAAAAQDKSDDTGSKVNGGDLGPAVRGMMVPAFENAALALKPGEISKPVRSQFGYHLIQLVKPGSALTEAERQEALDRYESPRSQQYLAGIIQRAKITNTLEPTPAVSPAGAVPPGARPPGVGVRPGGAGATATPTGGK